jgi:hypothetical protein
MVEHSFRGGGIELVLNFYTDGAESKIRGEMVT